MKKSIIYFILGALVVSTFAFVKADNTSVKDNFAESYSKILESAKAYTLEIAEAMPEDKYTFRPNDSVRSFGEQMAHIGMSSNFFLSAFIKGEELPPFDPKAIAEKEKQVGASKAETVKIVTEAFDDVIATLRGMDEEGLNETFEVFFDPNKPSFTKEQGFQFIRDHITHHRGQALVSLRMQDIESPRYRLY